MHVKCYWFSISVVLCYNVSERIYRKGEQSGVKQKLLLIDGNSILNRAFYGLPDMTNSQGLHTNAILGFLNIMFKFLEEENPTHLAVAFDLKAPTFRHKMFADYKGTRKGMPDELQEQVPVIREVLKAMNIPLMMEEGYEADDLLGTMSVLGEQAGFEVKIVSGDRDLLQLATKKVQIRIPKTNRAGTVVEDYYEDDVLEKYQVTPKEFIDVKALMGDASDNIPGIPGIGEKTATKLIKNGMSQKELSNMQKEIDKVDGVEWCLGMNSVIGSSIPSDMIPSSMKEMLQSDEYEMQFICSNYKSATEKVNKQINEINNIVKKYSPGSMVIGEATLMNDLETVTNVDLRNVNIASIAAIFVIILIVFKSISLPVILVAVIEFAICVNMAVPYYTGLSLPFVASIVIGTIQLGATVDYAILMTSRYQKERINGKKKMEAIRIAHETSMQSIITSGLSFFAATIGIAIYSNIDMISAICTLLARGAVISTVAVIFILPAMFMIFDKLICKTTLKMGHLE